MSGPDKGSGMLSRIPFDPSHSESRLMRLFLAGLLCTLSVWQPLHAVTFLTEENPPLNFVRDGKQEGVSTAVVQEMVKRAQLPATITVLPWTEAYSRAQIEADVYVYSTARLASRNNLFQWVGPIARGYWSAFALPEFKDKITKVEELKAYRIGIVGDARGPSSRTGIYQTA
jgi:hypothetical protein